MTKKEYKTDDELTAIGLKVIQEYPEFDHLRRGRVRIAYQTTKDTKMSKGRVKYADCEKIRDKLKGITPYDFVITFYGDTERLDLETKKRLMYHELCHVGYDPDEEKFSIIPHDLEDFTAVIRKWGVDWIDRRTNFVPDVPDPEEEDEESEEE